MNNRVLNATISIIFIVFIFSVWYNYYYLNTEHFQGKPPDNYIDILPNSGSDISKINVRNDSFKVNEVKKYFPSLIKKGIDKSSGVPLAIEYVDKNAMIAVGWKVANDLNTAINNQNNLLKDLEKSLKKSKDTLEITKEKCKI